MNALGALGLTSSLMAEFDLSTTEVVYADSLEALEYAFEQGVPRHVPVRTSAPRLVLDPPAGLTIHHLEAPIKPTEVEALLFQLSQAIPLLREQLLQAGVDYYLADRVLVVWYRKTAHCLYKLSCLQPDDYAKRSVVAGLDSPVPAHNMLYNPPWEILLGEQTPVITVRKPISAITPLTSTVITPPFRIRSKHHSRFFLEYKGWEKVSRWQPARFSKGIIYVAKTCPLVFETAVHLARQGYKLMPLPLTFPKSEVAGEMNLSVIKEVINKFFQHSIWSCYTTVLMKWGWEDIAKAVKTYYSDSHYYLDFFSKTSRVKAVLCNYPSSALAHACYQHSISLVGFQHGHASEISGWDHYFDIIKEPNRCDIFISFTQLAKETLSRKKMRVSKIFSVGVPHDYFASSYRRRTDNTIDILFVSKNIPMKYDAYPNSGMHDVQKTQLEYELVRNVFKHLPHSVMVKRYPTGTRGFLDTSVLEEEVSVAHNIEFDQHWYDLRYYFPYCRIVMVASFTSTLGWCVLAGKPLVFIDLPTHSPLLPALRETMEKSVFFFNGESNNFYENFRNFLNQPLSVIEQLWTEKTVEREHMVRQFFTDSHPDSAGKRAAMAIESELQAKKIVQADTVLVEGES